MSDVVGRSKEYAAGHREQITGRQSYHLTVPGTANAKDLSVVSYRVRETMGEAYRVPITLTHPDSLKRADYLGRDATFTIDHGDGTAPRKYCGVITGFSKLRSSKDEHTYKITVEAHIARLRGTRRSRIYQRKTAPEIIEAIMRKHGFLGHQFDFKLRRKYPQHDFRFQYQIGDWPYIRKLMEQEGIFCYITQGKFGDVVVFADDIDHYIYQPELKVLYREITGLASDQHAVLQLKTHAVTVPQSFLVADYNPAKAWERYKADANVAPKDTTTYGQPYVYGTDHLDQAGARWEAQLRHEAAIAWQVVYEGKSNVLELRPGRILRMDEQLPDAPNGQVIIEVTHTGGRDKPYYNRYKAIPSDRRFRLPIHEDTWPKISGTLSARVTSPSKYKYAYLTQLGLYVVRFDCDFDEWNPGGESVPLRLAKPFAGSLQTGFHFPLLDGTEVGICFLDGNPDKPYIAHAHHHSQATDLITNQDRWLSRNVIRTQSNNKIRLEDWEGEEHIKISTEHSGKSQLNLGHMVDSKRQKRGAGFELRTGAKGAIRVGQGLLISADDQPASGQQLEMKAAMAVLDQALQQIQALAEAASAAQAIAADYEKQKALLEGTLKDLKQAGILLSAPAGIAMASGSHLQLTAADNLIATAGGNADIGAVKNLTVAAGQSASVFAQQEVKLVAGTKDFMAQAQAGQMRLTASQDLKVTSVNGHFFATAGKSLMLSCDGAYIRLEGGNIELGCPGDITLKCDGHPWEGPASATPKLPALSRGSVNYTSLDDDGHSA